MNEPLLTPDEVAVILKRSAWFVRNELKNKRMRGTKVARQWGVRRSDLDAYIEARMNLGRLRRAAS